MIMLTTKISLNPLPSTRAPYKMLVFGVELRKLLT